MTFEAGPRLPYRLFEGCAAGVNSTSFLILGGKDPSPPFSSLPYVWQFEAAHGWTAWPDLTPGRADPGCAAYGRLPGTQYDFQWVIVSGGDFAEPSGASTVHP